MNARTYRRSRILIGSLVLIGCVLAFADIGHWLAAGVTRTLLWAQFAPSLSGLLTGGGWLAAGCIAVILLTLIFGRVYCAMLCPLGVLMDFSAWLAKRTGKKRRLPYHPGRPWLRVAAVSVCVVGLIAGTAVPLALLDPYSVFGKITSATLRPVLGAANQLLAFTSWIDPVKVSPVAWTTVGVAIGFLLMVVLAAVFRGRLWCNTICPVGAVLGLFSKHAWFRLQIADSACIGCSMCERVCPAQCIDFRNHRIDHSRCVMCLDCVTSCSRSGIHLKALKNPKGITEISPEVADPGIRYQIIPSIPAGMPECSASPPISDLSAISPESKGYHHSVKKNATAWLPLKRRHILTGIALLPTAALAGQHQKNARNRNRHAVLPPGAGSLKRFQNLCTGCQLCVTNCPDQVLRPSITKHGLSGFLQPYQDFDVSFCSYNCSNCSHICPTGAIQPITVEQRRLVRTGIAEFIPDLCVVKTNGTSCGACNEHCPTQAVHMVPYENDLTIPEIDPDLCIGCGGCEFICPVRPHKAIVVHGLAVHERAKPLDLGEKNTMREIEEEFPF